MYYLQSPTLAALWCNLDEPTLPISLPHQMLVGVAPVPGEHYVQIGNRYFVLSEVADPGKLHRGRESIPRSFEYVLIEPGRPSTRGRCS